MTIPWKRILFAGAWLSIMLPSAMVCEFGSRYGAAFGADLPGRYWGTVATAVLICQWQCHDWMSWYIRQVGAGRWFLSSTVERPHAGMGGYDAQRLAALTLAPVWLSSLALAAPSLVFNFVMAALGVAVSGMLAHEVIAVYARTREVATAAGIVQAGLGAGLVAWLLLLATILPL